MTTRCTVPLEQTVEAHLIARCADVGLLCWKFVSPGHRGALDRVVIGHDAHGDTITLYIDIKRPGQTPRPSQVAAIEDLRAHAVIAYTEQAVDALLATSFTDPTVPIAERDPCAAPLPGTRPPRIDADTLLGG